MCRPGRRVAPPRAAWEVTVPHPNPRGGHSRILEPREWPPAEWKKLPRVAGLVAGCPTPQVRPITPQSTHSGDPRGATIIDQAGGHISPLASKGHDPRRAGQGMRSTSERGPERSKRETLKDY